MFDIIIMHSELIILGITALVACCAAWIAYKSHLISLKALNINESEIESKKSNISTYIADGYKVNDRKNDDSRIIFSIAFTNKSDSIDSIIEVYLEIYYLNENDQLSCLMSDHEQSAIKWLSGNAKPAKLPIIIQPRSSFTNWFVFPSFNVIEKSKLIKKYKIIGKNGLGELTEIESYILREVEYGA